MWLVIVPVFYVLSIGPIWGLNIRGYLSDEIYYGVLVTTVYRPLFWISHQSETLHYSLHWYCTLWDPRPEPDYMTLEQLRQLQQFSN